MAEKFIKGLSGVFGIMGCAVLAAGCANGEAGMEEETAQESAALTVDSAAATTTAKPAAKDAKSAATRLSGGPSVAVTASIPADSDTYHQVFAVNTGSSISAETRAVTNGTSDTVLVLYQRSDNSSGFTSPYSNQINIKTLMLDDDGSGRYSKVSWANNTGNTAQVWLMCFGYCDPNSSYGCHPGTAELLINGSSVGTVNCTSGIYKADALGGYVKAISTIDSQLFVFNNTSGNDGFINDDCGDANLRNPSNSYDACITGLTSNSTWKGVSAYSSGSRVTGNVTIDYPGY